MNGKNFFPKEIVDQSFSENYFKACLNDARSLLLIFLKIYDTIF